MYSATTHNIKVSVKPTYLEDQSDPEKSHYVWAYQVTIENGGSKEVKLLTRYWNITDGNGRVEEVRGEGVVGKTPVLFPGSKFQYTSGCPLATPSGFMHGSYTMRSTSGDMLEVNIPAFSLDIPNRKVTLN